MPILLQEDQIIFAGHYSYYRVIHSDKDTCLPARFVPFPSVGDPILQSCNFHGHGALCWPIPSGEVKPISAPIASLDCLCGLVVRVPGYRSRGPGLDSRSYQILWEVVGLEGDSLSLVSITEELLERKSSDSRSRKPRLMAVGIRCAEHATPSISKIGTNFTDKRRSVGRYSSFAD
jgi:hypothetical protein